MFNISVSFSFLTLSGFFFWTELFPEKKNVRPKVFWANSAYSLQVLTSLHKSMTHNSTTGRCVRAAQWVGLQEARNEAMQKQLIRARQADSWSFTCWDLLVIFSFSSFLMRHKRHKLLNYNINKLCVKNGYGKVSGHDSKVYKLF